MAQSITGQALRKHKAIFLLALCCCFLPFMNAPFALLLGALVAQCIPHPFAQIQAKVTQYLLQVSVVCIGFGMNAVAAFEVGKEGFVFAFVSICSTLLLGLLLGKWLKIDRITSYLISAGTAICGGSAIATLAPVTKANERQLSVALGTIFLLNTVALFVFPVIGHALHLTQHQFGLWSAIAIHDTSSVVGAATKYGNEALQIATTVKLSRALWIVPVALLTATTFKTGERQVKLPYFILLFIIAMVLNTYVPAIHIAAPFFVQLGKWGLVLTLFFIGTSLSKQALQVIGWKALLQGVLLWVFISVLALLGIMFLS
ncbi:putative integral membrane protein (TIGR00698 family) [Chitinophaga skermanii]|uniref:Putative integral membrane protein (TIGR00698 family) n=1 Tax=Chitinophaga skermanii TaxID=331697 RepID=A0A327Q6J1_9BACT|nr:putative sulfate exporter family transporter [Chitinophaga skermanii]RAI99381.1 putative integral membrane protein (TIGR00698 family) [Chitinophaga skermanii]